MGDPIAEHLRFKLDPGYRIFGRNVSLNFGSSSFVVAQTGREGCSVRTGDEKRGREELLERK